MTWLVAGLVLFLGVHSVSIVAPAWRDQSAARLGEYPWKGLYSVVSIAGFAMLVHGFGLARQAPVVLYTPPVATRHLAALLMLPVLPLLFAAYLPGRIKSAVRHPMLLATILWAAAHLLANGTVADVLLFGAVGTWALVDRVSVARRPSRPVPSAPPGRANDAIAVVLGLALYVALVAGLHARLFGVSPLG